MRAMLSIRKRIADFIVSVVQDRLRCWVVDLARSVLSEALRANVVTLDKQHSYIFVLPSSFSQEEVDRAFAPLRGEDGVKFYVAIRTDETVHVVEI